MRLLQAACIATAWATCASASSAQDNAAMQRAYRLTYSAAMKCFIANGHAKGLRTRAGDPAKAAIYDQKARDAFNMAHAAGRKLGLDEQSVNVGIRATQDSELPKMVRDQAYFYEAVAACKSTGFM